MINNSTLSPTETTKRYGDTPTIEEILGSYAEKTNIYLEALEEKTEFTRDTEINFFDSNQMYRLIKFMIEHEMGSEAFNKYYPPDRQQFLDAMIFEGYNRGINSYGGKLGKNELMTAYPFRPSDAKSLAEQRENPINLNLNLRFCRGFMEKIYQQWQ